MNFDDLVEKKLVIRKDYPNGLSIYKYHRNVFYNQLWNADPRLLDARGMVLDADGDKVIWPFTKVFNYGENGTTCAPDQLVDVVRKVNGFMAAAALYKGELLISTTGTLDSEYVEMAREVITSQLNPLAFKAGMTYIFEICHKNDPHIVDEVPGAYLIGIRRMRDGAMATEYQLDGISEELNAFRPACMQLKFSEVLKFVKTVEHEGFMVRDAWTNETIMKIKSPYYLTKKFLMRMGAGKTELMVTNPTKFKESIDEEYHELTDFISINYRQCWREMGEHERREVIERFLSGGAFQIFKS